ncbi:MAG: OmpA family protein [Bacteroidales bacterium]
MLRISYSIFILLYIGISGLFTNKVFSQQDEKALLLKAYSYKSIDSLNSFISAFDTSSIYVKEAIRIRNQMAYEETKKENTLEAYQEFEKLYPNSIQIHEVKRWITNKVLKLTIETGDKKELTELLKSTNDPSIINKAEKEIEKIVFENAREANSIQAYNNYLDKYPRGDYSKLAKEKLEDLQFEENISSYEIDELMFFLLKYPNHRKHREIYDTLIDITLERNSIEGMNYLYYNNRYEINFQPTLIEFALNYTKNGRISSYDDILSKFPKLINSRAFAKSLKEAKEIDNIISLNTIDERTYKKYPNYFNTIVNDRSLELVKRYYLYLVSQRKLAQANKYISTLEDDFRVYEFKELINKPLSPKPNNINMSFTKDSLVMVYAQEKLNNYGRKDLYIAFKEDNYSKSILLPKTINSKYEEFNPIISPKGDYLYFYSDNGMNIGEYDLYISFNLNKDSYLDWTQPIKVNTIDIKNIRNKYSIGRVINQDNKPIESLVYIDDLNSVKPITRSKSNSINGGFAFLKPDKSFTSIGIRKGSIPVPSLEKDNITLKIHEVEDMITKHKLLTIPSLFDTINCDKLSKANMKYLEYLATCLSDIDYSLTISVHTQHSYKDMNDEELSSLQANIIKELLISYGMKSYKIIVAGYGKQNPLIGWEGKNRIEIGFINLIKE